MHTVGLLKRVVLGTTEGLQKWLAPCGALVHIVVGAIDVCILEQESHRQTEMITI
jgi:hypothetical protein